MIDDCHQEQLRSEYPGRADGTQVGGIFTIPHRVRLTGYHLSPVRREAKNGGKLGSLVSEFS